MKFKSSKDDPKTDIGFKSGQSSANAKIVTGSSTGISNTVLDDNDDHKNDENDDSNEKHRTAMRKHVKISPNQSNKKNSPKSA